MKRVMKKNVSEYLTNLLTKHDKKSFNLMIAGGSLLRILAECNLEDVDTEKWNIFFSDERCEDAHSNQKAARGFLEKVKGKVHSIEIEKGGKEAAKGYNELLGELAKRGGWKIDLCLLGIGGDGHICSIWPGTVGLDSEKYAEYVLTDSPISPERVTVTVKLLNECAREVVFVVPRKDGILQDVLEPYPEIRKRLKVDCRVLAEDA